MSLVPPLGLRGRKTKLDAEKSGIMVNGRAKGVLFAKSLKNRLKFWIMPAYRAK
jgi:hypothetical protein